MERLTRIGSLGRQGFIRARQIESGWLFGLRGQKLNGIDLELLEAKASAALPQWQDKERDEDGAAIPEKGPTFGGGPPGGVVCK